MKRLKKLGWTVVKMVLTLPTVGTLIALEYAYNRVEELAKEIRQAETEEEYK